MKPQHGYVDRMDEAEQVCNAHAQSLYKAIDLAYKNYPLETSGNHILRWAAINGEISWLKDSLASFISFSDAGLVSIQAAHDSMKDADEEANKEAVKQGAEELVFIMEKHIRTIQTNNKEII